MVGASLPSGQEDFAADNESAIQTTIEPEKKEDVVGDAQATSAPEVPTESVKSATDDVQSPAPSDSDSTNVAKPDEDQVGAVLQKVSVDAVELKDDNVVAATTEQSAQQPTESALGSSINENEASATDLNKDSETVSAQLEPFNDNSETSATEKV